jgi:hypothetical protein
MAIDVFVRLKHAIRRIRPAMELKTTSGSAPIL